MTVIAIGWSRGNKKAIATILPTKYWNSFEIQSSTITIYKEHIEF